MWPQVDCAYYTEDLHEIQYNPVKDMKAAVEEASGQSVEATCPECFDNARKWYCHNIVPKCGSFSSQVETAILPAAQDVRCCLRWLSQPCTAKSKLPHRDLY